MSTETKKSMQKIGYYITIVVLFGITFAGGVYVGYAHRPAVEAVSGIDNKTSPFVTTADFDTFWQAWQLLDQKFPGASKVDDQTRIYGAIKGLTSSFGDPYTMFFPPDENKAFESQVSGEFDGVGMEMGLKNGILTVIAPLKGTPADKAGILAGDQILQIDGKKTDGMDTDTAVNLIRGKKGTTVALSIARSTFTAVKVFTITRDTIESPTVDTKSFPDKSAFVISLYTFTAQSPQLFAQALDAYKKTGYQNLIIDLRNDPGGYLSAAVSIAGHFLPPGSVVVKEIGKNPDDINVDKTDGPYDIVGKKIYILANRGSASASEILSGALSEHGVATLTGEQTFGKGSVQEVVPLTDDTSLKITIAKWYTPNGVSISEKGLTPQIPLKMGANAPTRTNPQDDTELDQVLNLIK